MGHIDGAFCSHRGLFLPLDHKHADARGHHYNQPYKDQPGKINVDAVVPFNSPRLVAWGSPNIRDYIARHRLFFIRSKHLLPWGKKAIESDWNGLPTFR